MKKYVKRLFLLSIALFLISAIIIQVCGNKYSVVFMHAKANDNKIVVEEKDGKIEILEKKVINNKYVVKIKAIKPGKVSLYVNHGDFQEGKTIYIHKNMVITDNSFFGKSTCSEVIPLSLSITLIYGLYLFIKIYKRSLKENIFQYKNIAYLGIIIFTSLFIINNILSIFNYQGLYETINKMISSSSFISIIFLPISFVIFIIVSITNFYLIIKEGKSLNNLLGLFLGIFICLFTLLPDFTYNLLMKLQIVDIYNLNGPGPYIYNFLETLVYLTVTYLECILIATIIIAIKSIKKKIELNKDYIIILGCQIRKDGTLTPLLKGRVDRALDFRNKQLKETKKDIIFIPSGGKGPDEIISESEAMKNYLLEQGIKEKNIIIENKSKNTYENIKFSNKLIKNKKANIIFSTTNYHVLRAGLLATEQGLILEGIGSKTKAYFWINAFIREFIGTIYSERKKHILFFILINIIIIIMIGITYLGNNL